MSESFNVVIVDARKKPIITMLEELRMYIMEKVFNKKYKGLRWGNQICPTIREIVNEIKKGLRHYQVLPSRLNQFEVRGTTDSYEVDLEERTRSCRLWQLNEIGCVHSVAAISFMNRDVESYVDKMFSSITYMKAYKFRLAPMNGSNLWPATDYTPPLPPVRRTMHRRPATKRKRDAIENPHQSSKKSKKTTQTQNKGKEQVKVSKAGKKQKCSLCKIEGHNKRACTLTRHPKIKDKRKTKQGVAEALNEDDEDNQANAMNEGDEVHEGDQAVNDDGGAVNDGGEVVNEVHVQQDYDEVELTHLEFDASANGEPGQLGKKVGGADAPGNSEAKPITLE
uniref:SWIM-type domain-containing protein n=1 Tax=Lactuca sativa TaxID=4236 RepID=A0A9R1X7S2_LACSA|nr:hypothetical protein LSAT_V11C600333870 [Lactuca sativa]